MSNFNLGALALTLLFLNACQTAPIKKWGDLSYGSDRKGENVVVAAPVILPAEITACEVTVSGNAQLANWDGLAAPSTPTEEIYQKLITSNHFDAVASTDARKLVNTALEIHRGSGVSVVGLDTCDVLQGETLPTYLHEVEESYAHLQQTGEFCATSFAGIAINDQIAKLNRTPEGAVMSVAKYQYCALGPPGTGQAALDLADAVHNMRESGRTQLNPDEYRCSR
jgi:hypothetical protein